MSLSQATVTNSNTTILTVGSGGNVALHSLIFANYSGASAETLTVYLVPSGSSAGNSTTILKSYNVPASTTLIWNTETPIYLDSGDSVIAIGATGSLVTATANYENRGLSR